MKKESNVVLNFKMNGQVEYAKTIRDINAIMNAAASEYRTHIAAMGKDADQTKKLAAEKKKLEVQLEAGRERTKMLRAEYEAMAKDTQTTTTQLANKYRQLQNSERAELALERALERVNEELSEQAIESRKAEQALNKLEDEASALEIQTEKLNAEYELQVAQLGENAKESDKLRLKMDHLNDSHELAAQKVKNYEEQLEQAKKQYGENSAEADKYETQLLEARTAEQQLANEIKATNKQLKEQGTVLDKTSKKLKKAGDAMLDVGKKATMKVSAPIAGLGAVAAKTAIDFESSFADVRKTVDETEEGFEKLSDGIREMSKELPTSASEIAQVTAMAGQLGIQNEHLLTFTRTMIDLGVATDMSGEQAATTLARLANITNMSQENFDRLGSTLVDLGNNFAATEGEIAEMAMRIAGAGSQIRMSEADILGFSTALASVGIRAEAGGSAISKLMIEMASEVEQGGEKLEEFARVAGLSVDDFSKAFKDDAATAIFTFLGGLGELSEEGESAFAIIDELGLSEIRLRDTILRTSNAREMANEALATANNAWKENTALEEEAAERYKTTASQLSILKNEITDVAIDLGNILIPVILDVVDAIRPWIERFKELDESTKRLIVIIGGIVTVIGPVILFIGSVIKAFGAIVGAVKTVIGVISGLTKVFGLVKGAIAALTGPIGWIIAGIAALIAIGIALWKNWDKVKEFASKLWNDLKNGFTNVKDVIVNFFTVTIPEAFNSFVNKLKSIFDTVKNSVINFFTVIPEAFNSFVEFISGIPETVMEFLSQLFLEDIPYAVGYGIGWLVTKVTEGFNDTVEFFKELPGRVMEFLTQAIENITKWASDTKDKAVEAGTEFINNIVNYFQELPGRIWKYLTDTYSRISTWVSNTKDKAIEAGTNFLNNIIDYLKKLPGRVWDFLSETISKMIKFAGDMKDKAVETGKNVYNSIVGEVKQIPGRLKRLGSDIITGLVDGVKNSIGKVVNIAKDIASSFVGGFKKAMGIKSPSVIMRQLGKFVSEGLGLGIEDEADFAINKTVNMAKSVTGAVEDGIKLPNLEMGTVVRQPTFTQQTYSGGLTMAALNNIGTNIKESLAGLSGTINVNVFLDTDQLNTKLAPGMSKQLDQRNQFSARSKGVITV